MSGGLLLSLLAASLLLAGSSAPRIEIEVQTEPLAGETERLTVTARYTGEEAGLTYRLETVHSGASGQSRSVQSGSAQSESALAVSSVVVRPGDVFTARLSLLRDEVTVEEVDWERGGR